MIGGSVTSPVFGVLLVLHIGVALVGFGAMVGTGIQGWRLGRVRDASSAGGLRRYFRPGTNWAARAVYLVPVLGVALVVASGGSYRFDDPFVELGAALWVVAIVLAETVLWPAERRVQQLLASSADRPDAELRRLCRQLSGCAPLLTALFVAAVTVMAVKP